MENEIEDLIRKDFEHREIDPSTNALGRLDEKLHAHSRLRYIKRLRIVGYAASIIGLIFIVQFTVKNIKKTNGIEVAQPATIETGVLPTFDKATTTIAQEEKESILEELDKTNTTAPTVISNRQRPIVHRAVADVSEVEERNKVFTGLIGDTSTHKIRISIKDSLDNSMLITEVTEEELDALLAAAQQTLDTKGKDSLSVNARRMLYEIEVEINKPLPEKVLLTIKNGTKTIKEIVQKNNNDNN